MTAPVDPMRLAAGDSGAGRAAASIASLWTSAKAFFTQALCVTSLTTIASAGPLGARVASRRV